MNQRIKLLYLSLLPIIAIGFFFLGQIHKPMPVAADGIDYVPDFSSRTPYLALTYDQCPPNVSVPEEYTCIYNLAYSTLDKADVLANKLMQTSSTKDGEQMDGFYDSLHKSVQSAQKARDTYFDAVCDADSLLVYGGSGILSEQRACMYFHAKQYLNVLQKLQSSL